MPCISCPDPNPVGPFKRTLIAPSSPGPYRAFTAGEKIDSPLLFFDPPAKQLVRGAATAARLPVILKQPKVITEIGALLKAGGVGTPPP